MPDPTFIIIGAQKCGTTWLSQMLGQHPDVYLTPKKELNFFNKIANYQKGIDWYRSQFELSENKIAIGESTPNYFWTSRDEYEIKESGRTHDVPGLMAKYYPHIKILLILRDPVERAISAFYHHIRDRAISPNSRILEVCDHFGILTMGFYDVHLERWLNYFKREQFLILIYEKDICQNKYHTLKKVFRFLEIPSDFQPKKVRRKYNSRDGHLYMRVNYYTPLLAKTLKFVCQPLMAMNFPKIVVTAEEKKELMQRYAIHSTRLEMIAEIDVPWKKKKESLKGVLNPH